MKNYLTFLVFLFTMTVFGQVTQVKSNIDSGWRAGQTVTQLIPPVSTSTSLFLSSEPVSMKLNLKSEIHLICY